MNNKKKIIGLGVVILLLLGGILFAFNSNKNDEISKDDEEVLAEVEPSEEVSENKEEPEVEEKEETEEIATNVEESKPTEESKAEAKPEEKPQPKPETKPQEKPKEEQPKPNPPTPPEPPKEEEAKPAPEPPKPAPMTYTYRDGLSTELMNLINEYRVQNGLYTLKYDSEAHQRAKERALYNAQRGEYDHEIRQLGIMTGLDSTAQEFLQCWKNSPGNNKFLLSEMSVGIGIAVYERSDGYFFIIGDFPW